MTRTIVVVAVSLAIPSVVIAEVSDKVISPGGMWGMGVIGAIVGFASGWLRPAALWVGLPVGVLIAAQGLATVLDEFVGPAVIKEQGLSYVAHATGSVVMVIAGGILGALLHHLHRRRIAGVAAEREVPQ